MAKTIIEIITALGAIGTFVSVIITFAKMLKVVKTVNFKAEKLYGKEAVERYNKLLEKIPEKYRDSFGPDEYTGGNKSTPPNLKWNVFILTSKQCPLNGKITPKPYTIITKMKPPER
ncbi:MAG: hypothetical protein Pg6C_18440 [Treponemataceae bacterium]|nr:MAG: hypothetical protein Pg6C_18440 [Treponemataceae bacterium]